jgi:hypothetical protein
LFLRAICDLWYFDLEARRRYQLRTVLIAFLYGVFNSLALGRGEDRVTWETLGLVGLLTVAFTMSYCLRKVSTQYVNTSGRLREFFRKRGFLELGLVSAIVVLCASLFIYFPSRKAEAFSLNSQLRAVTSPEPLAPQIVMRMGSVFETARARNLSLNPHLVNVASEKLLNESRSNADAWPAVLGLLNYRSGLGGKEITVLSQGHPCFVPPPNGALFSIEDLSIVDCNGQSLDGLRLKNVVVRDSTITYHGGSAVLENVQFENCRFVLDYSPASLELAHTLAASTTVTITLPGK